MESLNTESNNQYHRRNTTIVHIGDVPLGGKFPIRIQSMTNTPTDDIAATTSQIKNIYDAGSDYVRITVPSRHDAESLAEIINELTNKKCSVPLIADIHFNPQLALIAAAIVNKVRINPGNFIDRKTLQALDYNEEKYNLELEKLRYKFLELLEVCKKNGTAIRLGSNHGSLSDRIMNRYGDTPEGMAESVMEFLRICKEQEFDEVVVSMKSSNTRVMVFATRLLVKKMEAEGMFYPLHLGVTEAGEGEDGRIKSAVGTGTLLADGIGDTIRVSLTEDPEAEIPVARKIVDYIESWENHTEIPAFGNIPIDIFSYHKRETLSVGNIGSGKPPVVIRQMEEEVDVNSLSRIGWNYLQGEGWRSEDLAPDILSVGNWPEDISIPEHKIILMPFSEDSKFFDSDQVIPMFTWNTFNRIGKQLKGQKCIQMFARELDEDKLTLLKKEQGIILVLETDNTNGFADHRSAIFRMINTNCQHPVILKRKYSEKNKESFQLKSSIDLGGLFIDGLGDGIWLENKDELIATDTIETAFGILQASRVRVSKTEYISCPSCGRTLFDLQSTTKKIRERTSHLKGLKIGIMGCIVNGPGEMADADYGYVGTGKGKVNLYKAKTVIKKNIPEQEAVDELIGLIKENGDWVNP